MISEDLARILILITMAICVAVMPLAYVAKHRWGNMALTRALSAAGIVSMLALLMLAVNFIPD